MTTATAPLSAASSTRNMARSAAPLIALGTTWVVRKAMMKAYEGRTGKPAPVVYSREASVVSKVIWAATMAATVALIEIVVTQVLDGYED
jgi:hypothetical protein